LAHGVPTAANPDAQGNLVHAFHMPSACQLNAAPSQAWNASHISYDHGRNRGFVQASGPVAMGYFTDEDLPFYYGLGPTFPPPPRRVFRPGRRRPPPNPPFPDGRDGRGDRQHDGRGADRPSPA